MCDAPRHCPCATWHKAASGSGQQAQRVLDGGTSEVDAQGDDVRSGARPREFDELVASLSPRGERVFFGAYDAAQKPIGLAERVTRAMPAAREALPEGDFRDWDEIEAWARGIATELRAWGVRLTDRHPGKDGQALLPSVTRPRQPA